MIQNNCIINTTSTKYDKISIRKTTKRHRDRDRDRDQKIWSRRALVDTKIRYYSLFFAITYLIVFLYV